MWRRTRPLRSAHARDSRRRAPAAARGRRRPRPGHAGPAPWPARRRSRRRSAGRRVVQGATVRGRTCPAGPARCRGSPGRRERSRRRGTGHRPSASASAPRRTNARPGSGSPRAPSEPATTRAGVPAAHRPDAQQSRNLLPRKGTPHRQGRSPPGTRHGNAGRDRCHSRSRARRAPVRSDAATRPRWPMFAKSARPPAVSRLRRRPGRSMRRTGRQPRESEHRTRIGRRPDPPVAAGRAPTTRARDSRSRTG